MKWIILILSIFCMIRSIPIVKAGIPITQESKSIHIQGVIKDGGVICPLLLADNGTQISLQGVDKNRYPVGTRLLLDGYFVRVSKCMQGTKTFQIKQILKLDFPQ